MIVNQLKLKEAIIQALEEINDSLYDMRLQGFQCLLPAAVEFQVNMVTADDNNVITRSFSEADADGGTTVTLREQLAPDVEQTTREGENFTTTRTPGEAGTSVQEVTHPQVQTSSGGGDRTDETVINTYGA